MNEQTKKTVNQKELETLAFWQENKIFEKSVDMPAGKAPRDGFSFFDGPPFATGVPHHGHLLAGTIKDIIPRYKTMQGYSVRRVWGWDCHGLPLENLVEKKFELKHKKDIENFGIKNFNEAARDMVFEYESEWKKVIPRMGRFVDMSKPYKTMDASYTESIWWSFKNLYDKGLIYEGSKIMHICPRCETSLAQSEVALGYADVTDISVTAKFELVDEPGTFVLAWTTTPWTLPGNVALAISENSEYVLVNNVEGQEDANFIVAKERVEDVFKNKTYSIKQAIDARTSLIGKKYKPVFDYFNDADIPNKDNIYTIVSGPFVTTDSGTGIVHIAPAFGSDDYELGRAENLPMIKHVNMDGTFVAEVTDLAGLYVKQKGDTQSTDIEIIKKLAHSGKLFSKEKLVHSYPHCWRCDTPLLNYATSSWFMDILQIKGKLIDENKKIGWVPEHTKEGRFGKWLEGARDWALSRSRYWGAPLPVWKCSECSRVEVIGSLEELKSKLVANNTYAAVRHGECIGNSNDEADSSGNPENHLTEQGRAEVLVAAQKFAQDGYDMIISSPLVRAQETAQIISKECGITEILTDKRLKEMDFGVHDGKKFDTFWDEVKVSHANFDIKIDGGESYRDISERLSSLFFECEEKYLGKKILFVTHGGVIWIMISLVNNFSDNQTRELRNKMKVENNARYFIPNAYLKKLDFKPFPHSPRGLDFHRPYIDEVVYGCGQECTGEMKRISDVFDCWYESGSMPFASMHYPFENKELFDQNFPADFIAEGLDQTRGWFYSLLNLSVGLFGKSSYKQVIVNGLTMAADGQKMSKKDRNYTNPMELVEKYGADSLRFALVNSPLVRGENTVFPDSLVDEVSKKLLQRLENVYSFYEMYQDKNILPSNSSQNVLDHYIRSRLHQTIANVTSGLERYELDSAARVFESFFDDLSTWYLRRSRDRLKGDTNDIDRVLAIETLGYVLLESSKVLAPFMPFLAERIYQGIASGRGGHMESVHLESWPIPGHIDELAIVTMDTTRKMVSLGLEARNKTGIKVRQPLQALSVKSLAGLTEEYFDLIKDEVNVKEILEDASLETEVSLDTTITASLQVEGNIRELARAIKDLRKEAGLMQGDRASLLVITEDQGKAFIEEISSEVKKLCGLEEILFEVASTENTKEIILSDVSYKIHIK